MKKVICLGTLMILLVGCSSDDSNIFENSTKENTREYSFNTFQENTRNYKAEVNYLYNEYVARYGKVTASDNLEAILDNLENIIYNTSSNENFSLNVSDYTRLELGSLNMILSKDLDVLANKNLSEGFIYVLKDILAMENLSESELFEMISTSTAISSYEKEYLFKLVHFGFEMQTPNFGAFQSGGGNGGGSGSGSGTGSGSGSGTGTGGTKGGSTGGTKGGTVVKGPIDEDWLRMMLVGNIYLDDKNVINQVTLNTVIALMHKE